MQIQELQHTLTAKHPGWLGFCHNDLQYGNMLMDVMNPEELAEESPAEQVFVQAMMTAAALHSRLTCPSLPGKHESATPICDIVLRHSLPFCCP